MEDNILSSGIEGLKELREKLVQLDRFQNDNSSISVEEKKLEKAIDNKEKAVEEEVGITIKKRKDEIEATYDQEISKTEEQIKKVENNKSKAKNAQVSERIDIETSELRDEYEQMRLEAANKFKKEKIPGFLNSKVFFALYMPKGLKDYGIIALVLISVLLAIPCSIYFLLISEPKVIHLITIYVLTVLVFGSIYLFLGSKVKDKHLQTMKEVRVIRTNMNKNKAIRNKIQKKIQKDKDESSYSLEAYDEEISKLKEDIEGIADKKKEAVANFDNNTAKIIIEEIKRRHEEELINLNTELKQLSEKARNNNENIKYLSLDLVDNYEAYLGKELMSVEKIDQFIGLMDEKNLLNISEAISMHKKGSEQ